MTRSQRSLYAHLSPASVAEAHALGAQTQHCPQTSHERSSPQAIAYFSNSLHFYLSAVSSSSPSSKFLEVLGLLLLPNDGYMKERILSPYLTPVSSIDRKSVV